MIYEKIVYKTNKLMATLSEIDGVGNPEKLAEGQPGLIDAEGQQQNDLLLILVHNDRCRKLTSDVYQNSFCCGSPA